MVTLKDCCHEMGCRRSKPILVRQGALTGLWYVITDYDEGPRKGIITSKRRHVITPDFDEYLKEQGWTSPVEKS